MKIEETRVTQKYQTTIPKEVRKRLNIKPKQSVTWHVLRNLVVVDIHKKVEEPVKFLTSQTRMSVDAVELVREGRRLDFE